MGIKYGYNFTWSREPGSATTITSRHFDTPEERDADWLDTLRALDYEPPKWWQWWRWNEHVPPCWKEAVNDR